jgi:hypothetical protein
MANSFLASGDPMASRGLMKLALPLSITGHPGTNIKLRSTPHDSTHLSGEPQPTANARNKLRGGLCAAALIVCTSTTCWCWEAIQVDGVDWG